MMDLEGKTVLVTGCSRGIGAAITRALGAAGAHVIVHYASDRHGAEAAAAGIPSERKLLVEADFCEADSAQQLWKHAIAWRERIDVLVNNAAIMLWNGGIDADDERWDQVWKQTLQVNVQTPATLLRHALRHFRASGGGVVITISSWVAHRGVTNPDTLAYAASKAAIRSVTQTIARAYARENILAYVIAPGVVDTQMSESFASTQPGGKAAVQESLAMGEWVPPEEIAQLVTFLASGRSRHLSGATLDVNGASYIR